MCIAIYLALIGLFIFYSDYIVNQYGLTTMHSNGDAMVIAVGWEMVPILWPLLVAAMVVASAATLFVARRLTAK